MKDNSASRDLPATERVEILECTLRDGSYAVSFQFTENDTAALAGVLGSLGFHWIEVGHGMGLGAATAGKGAMPATDERLIEVAKMAAPQAQIGCFFIPGIGTADQLKSARDAGLDFIRIGCNAPEIETAFPYLTLARELGLTPCLNFMKSYGISAEVFAQKAKSGAKAGAEVIYCVDSAGTMLPEDVRRYISAAHERCDCNIGFHGHSNLQFAVANALEAVRCGATFIDTTLYGLGRSAGNVPTEIAVGLFQRLGIETGIDLFEVMDAAEEFIEPLLSQIQLYDMLSVATGLSRFHSAFLPRVAIAARNHGVELRRLVVAMGKLDPIDLDDEMVNRVASTLRKSGPRTKRAMLTSFSAPGMSPFTISNSLRSVTSLIEGMLVTCAKSRARPVLEIAAAESPSSDFVLADLVLAERSMVLGRVVYGSFEILEEVLRIAGNNVPLFLNDRDGGSWAAQWPETMKSIVGPERILPIHSMRLFAEFTEDVIDASAQRCGNFCLIIYGAPDPDLLRRCSEAFASVVVQGKLPPNVPDNCRQMEDFSDRMHLDVGVQVALLLCPPDHSDVIALDRLLSPEGVFITKGFFPRVESELSGRAIVRIDRSDAYRGQMDRWVAISNLMKSAHSAQMVAQ